MVQDFALYLATVLICIVYPLVMHSYPRWRIYFSIGLAGFMVCGAVLTYLNAKDKEEVRIKIGQLERELEDAKKETEKQKSMAKDFADEAHSLSQQLKTKNEEMRKELKQLPKVDGEIRNVRLFLWQRQSASKRPSDDAVTTMGILVFAHIENQGASTTLANWELGIELPDRTIIRPQKWPVQRPMRISCEDGAIDISKDQYLDASSKKALQKNEDRAGLIIWLVKNIPVSRLWAKGSSYTVTARDHAGVVHALQRFDLASLPQKCFGFEVLD
jgi:hypothetical protein